MTLRGCLALGVAALAAGVLGSCGQEDGRVEQPPSPTHASPKTTMPTLGATASPGGEEPPSSVPVPTGSGSASPLSTAGEPRPGSISRAELKELVQSPRPTYGEVRSRYDLRIVEGTPGRQYGFDAISGQFPGLKLYFLIQAKGGPVAAVLESLQGTAAVLLSDYVGMKFADIPGFVMDRGNGGRIWDSVGYFTINLADVNEAALSADDEVYLIG